MSLKLGFAIKRKHDPKGIVDFHLKHNHFKVGYTHKEAPDDFIYQGVDTFSEVLERDKVKNNKVRCCYTKRILGTRFDIIGL